MGLSKTYTIGGTDTCLSEDVLQAIDNILVQIGAVELKGLLYEHILPAWQAYTDRFPLGIDDIIMRSKEWVEIKPLNPDQGVIVWPFFKSGKMGLTFKTGCCIILFHIPNAIYNQYINNLDRNEMERMNQEVCRNTWIVM